MKADPPRLHAPSARRNREPILEVLRQVLPAEGVVLEVASGSGQHAVFFAQHLPRITWQPTDPTEEARDSIDAWRRDHALPNVLPAVRLDVHDAEWPVAAADAVVCINMIHISPWSATEALMRGAAAALPSGAPLVTYGPYRRGGAHTAPSNAEFDASLKSRDPAWGVRDMEAVIAAAAAYGLEHEAAIAMPANNFSLVFRRV